MTIGQALRAHLLTQSAVTALVVARIYPGLAPEETSLPLVTYDVGTTAEGSTQTGVDGLALSPITVSCEATEHDAAVSLRAFRPWPLDSPSRSGISPRIGCPPFASFRPVFFP